MPSKEFRQKYLKRRDKEIVYKSELLKKAQVHKKFPDIVYRKRSYEHPFDMFVRYFRLTGPPEKRVEVLKHLVNFMEMLEREEVDCLKPIAYYPLYVLNSRWLLKWTRNYGRRLNKTGRLWLDAAKEAIEIKERDLEELKNAQEEPIDDNLLT